MVGSGPLGVKRLALYGMLGALLFAVQVALSPLPNIELVSTLLIALTLSLGYRALYPLYVFVLLQGLLYGFGLWFLNYCYVWLALVLAVRAMARQTAPLFWAVVAGAFGLSFGALCALPYLAMGGPQSALAYWLNGIPFDVLHALGNFAGTWLLLGPVNRALGRLLEGFG